MSYVKLSNLERISDSVSFLLGTSADLNSSGAHSGDLDPMQGMYWAWHSGYINFKLEGVYSKNGNYQEFRYHIGGFQDSLATAQWVGIGMDSPSTIALNLQKIMQGINPLTDSKIMHPCKEAVEFSKRVADAFSQYE